MLKLFNFLENSDRSTGNKLKTFLFFAIAEVFMVVLGILIAVQINNWNEYRKELVLEKEYILRLKKEAEENLQMAKDQQLYSRLQKERASLLLKALEGDTIFADTEPLVVALEHIGYAYPMQPADYVWDDLNNTGNIRLIQSDSIKEYLAFFHSEMGQMLDIQEEIFGYNLGVRRLVGDALPPYLKLEVTQKLHPLRYAGGLTHPLPTHQALKAKLKKLEGLNGYLIDIISSRNVVVYVMGGFVQVSEQVIQFCEHELAKE